MRNAIAAALGAAMIITAQTDDIPTFRASVSLVRVDVKITGRDGRTVNDLGREDFIVFDEETPRDIVEFTRESDRQKLRLLLLLDVSGSMSRMLGEVAARASEALRPLESGDQAGLMVFADRAEVVQPFTTDVKAVPEKIVNSVFKTVWGRGTRINDALLAAAKYVGEQPGVGRRAILLVTDNEGARTSVADGEVIRALHAGDIVLSAILTAVSTRSRSTGPYADPASRPPDVTAFVRNTGGDIVAGEDPATVLARMVREITTRYSLQYPAPQAEAGSYRKIRIELSPAAKRRYPNAMVQSRTGYYAE
jgi:VWFA-related protein